MILQTAMPGIRGASPRMEPALGFAEAFALGHTHSPTQRDLLAIAMQSLRSQVLDEGPGLPCVRLPVLVHAALRAFQSA